MVIYKNKHLNIQIRKDHHQTKDLLLDIVPFLGKLGHLKSKKHSIALCPNLAHRMSMEPCSYNML